MKFPFFAFFLLLFIAHVDGLHAQSEDEVSRLIRFRMESDEPMDKIEIRMISLLTTDEIIDFYNHRAFEKAWSQNGLLTKAAYDLRLEILQSEFDGLTPEDYHLSRIESFFRTFEANKANGVPNEPGDLADFDIFLSDAFFHLARNLEIGKVDPSKFGEDWEIARKEPVFTYPVLLEQALAQNDIHGSMELLYPKFSIYKKGREVIRELVEKVKEDTLNWKKVKIDKAIRVGESNSVIPRLRERLIYWGLLEEYNFQDVRLYDSIMMDGIKDFQGTHGLDIDGIIGKKTVLAFNDSPQQQLNTAIVNMERLRWLPDTVKNAEFILVNIANFQLDYLKNLDTLFSERVIVGKKYHESPIFMADMSYIVFSPYWNIPYSITQSEIIPSVRRNPNYISEKNMEVITPSGKVVDPSTINWNSKSFPYLVRQKPGEGNSLGLVKFMFPNKHNVYIHDTNARSLFALDDRALSHGCIRVRNPQDFAKVLLADDPTWTMEGIQTAMHQTQEQVVQLNRKIPVVLVYLTFWADSKGEAHFREDIYDRDEKVLLALKRNSLDS
ncbi:L,D-transpeptidase family protein [Algoriphagus halophilus]|uniref:Murein L,D-transpeptidase YcbB/YkuD n=1 Tax=Algoriphagus halophilus TaxID=226505 RepID=A0A1N6D9Z8_9BACT|nr:L,D-transpeptidase family protein [Algoriphagus halophilus]SIN67622.1 Murein L,D-transpeptidase YcbB/YkuD [Algoriphagus halophilus]